jgi:lysophospholipase L1-like esterase
MKISFARNMSQAFILSLFSIVSISRGDNSGASAVSGGLQPGDVVALCGDSITQQKLYTMYMADYLLMCQPQPKLSVVQFGWSGQQASDFFFRMKNDVIPFKPTVATICYGMNDGRYAPRNAETRDKYRKYITDIVDTFKANGVRSIVVGSPTAVDTYYFKITPGRWDRAITADAYNQTLADFGQVDKEVAQQEGVTFADLHDMMAGVMARATAQNGVDFCVSGPDGVHPLSAGHIIIAYAFLKALGCDGNIGTITVDMMANKAEATAGTTVISCDNGDVQLESTRYPFCFYGDDPKDAHSTKSILPFLPFNHDLNRYMLVVKNAPAASLKVTWGKQSKVFPSAALAKGVNLADEFLDNPFSGPFMDVQQAIADQQNFETVGSQQMLHSINDWGHAYPEFQDILAPVFSKVIAKWESMRDASAAAVVPVKHEIKIEAAP